jgi:hypothetical protein
MKNSKTKRGMLAPLSARDPTIKFFDELFNRRFSEADRSIKKISEKKLNGAQFKEGYINALEGILLSNRTGDERELYNKLTYELSEIQKYKKEFRDFTVNSLHSEFDKGFFSAWHDLMHYQENKED